MNFAIHLIISELGENQSSYFNKWVNHIYNSNNQNPISPFTSTTAN